MTDSPKATPSDIIGQLTSMVGQRKSNSTTPIPTRPVPSPSRPAPLDESELRLVELPAERRREPNRPRPGTAPRERAASPSGLHSAPASDRAETIGAEPAPPAVGEGTASAARQRLMLLTRDQIISLPDQPRTSQNVKVRLGELADSIAKIGLRVPLQGRWDATVEKYQVFDGHRRLMALDQLIPSRPDLGENIPMLVLADSEVAAWQTLDDHERMFLLSLVVNTVREDLSKADRGRAYKSFIDKFGVEGTARLLGISRVSVWRNLKAARDSDQHTQRGETFGQPAWLPKYWVRTARSVLKLSAERWEPQQREATSRWLRAVARAMERGDAKLPPFPTAADPGEVASYGAD